MARKINTKINGSEYFRVTATVGRDSNGKAIRKQFYGNGRSDAESKRDEYLNNIKNGLNVNYKDMILGDLLQTWLFETVRIKVKPSSFEKYEGIYRNYLKNSGISGTKIYEIKSLQLQRFYNELYKNGKSGNSIKSLNKLLKTFLNYAVDEGYLMKNPCLGGKIIIPGVNEIKHDEIEVFTDEEIHTLSSVMKDHRLNCLILIALGTGLRQGELLALKWSDIDMNNKTVTVNKTIKRVKIFDTAEKFHNEIVIQSPKTKSSNRTVPIPSNLIPVLKKHDLQQKQEKLKAGTSYNDNELIFATSTGNPISSKNLFNSYSCLLTKAKIPHKKFHALRHTYATKLFEKDEQLKTVSVLLGHSDISITANIYTHVMPEKKTNAAEKLNELFK
jgi:integrase